MDPRENPMRPRLGTLVGVTDMADEIKLFQIELNGDGFVDLLVLSEDAREFRVMVIRCAPRCRRTCRSGLSQCRR